jgi:hypothetical protein
MTNAKDQTGCERIGLGTRELDGAALVPRQTNHLVLTRGFPIAAFGARSAVGIEFDLLIREGTINRQSVACDLCIITGRPESTTLRMAYQCK